VPTLDNPIYSSRPRTPIGKFGGAGFVDHRGGAGDVASAKATLARQRDRSEAP